MFRFEKLDAWQLAIEFSDDIYRITRGFPADERFGLTNQLRRAAVSIAANIAEGSRRSTDKDFARFIEVAYGSLMETVSHMTIALRQSMMNAEDHQMLYEKSDRMARILSGLRKSRGE